MDIRFFARRIVMRIVAERLRQQEKPIKPPIRVTRAVAETYAAIEGVTIDERMEKQMGIYGVYIQDADPNEERVFKMFPEDYVLLETERLILREYTKEDFPAMYAMLSDPVTMQHYLKPYDETGVKRWLEWSQENYRKHGFGWWAMELKATGEFIGDCGITMQDIDGQLLPEIGYHIHKDYWRQGYGKEAAKAVRDWGFTHRDFDCLYAYMTAGNVASWSTAAAIGMKKIKEYQDPEEGVLYVYAISRRDWEQMQ